MPKKLTSSFSLLNLINTEKIKESVPLGKTSKKFINASKSPAYNVH